MMADDDDESGVEENQKAKKMGGATGKFLVGIEDGFQCLKTIIDSRAMTFFSLLFIVQWHVIPLIPDLVEKQVKPSKFWRQIGINVLVFQFYYANQFEFLKGKNFMSSISLIFFDTVVVFYACQWFLVPTLGRVGYVVRRKKEEFDELQVDNWYMDVTRQFRKGLLCFFAQSGLVMYYVFELNSDKDTHQESNVSVLQWLVALMIIEIAGDDEMGSSFNATYWKNLLKALPKTTARWRWVLWIVPAPIWLEFYFRAFMDMMINGVARTMILGTAPIMLCVEGHMDFVKDVTALFFIMKLDDIEPIVLTSLVKSPDDEILGRLGKMDFSSPLQNIPFLEEWIGRGRLPGETYTKVFLKDLENYSEVPAEEAEGDNYIAMGNDNEP